MDSAARLSALPRATLLPGRKIIDLADVKAVVVLCLKKMSEASLSEFTRKCLNTGEMDD